MKIEKYSDEWEEKDIAKDSDVIRQVRASRENRRAGRTYTGEDGLTFLRQQIQKFEQESQ